MKFCNEFSPKQKHCHWRLLKPFWNLINRSQRNWFSIWNLLSKDHKKIDSLVSKEKEQTVKQMKDHVNYAKPIFNIWNSPNRNACSFV